MCVRCFVASKFLAFGLACLAAAEIFVGSTREAKAQDLNIQSQIETFAPPLIMQPLSRPDIKPKEIEREGRRGCSIEGRKSLKESLSDAVMALPENKPREFREQGVDTIFKRLKETRDPDARRQLLTEIPLNQRREVVQRALAGGMTAQELCVAATLPVKYKVKSGKLEPQGAQWKFSFPMNPTYESNVFKSNQNIKSDESFGVGGGVQFTGGAGSARPLDLVAFSGGIASARYSQNTSKSTDIATLTAVYQYFIQGVASDGTQYLGDGRIVFAGSDHENIVTAPSLITTDTLQVGIQNSTGYAPTFHAETVDLFTPQMVLGRQNIELPGGNDCFSKLAKSQQPPPKSPNEKPDLNLGGFCNYLDVSAALGQTFSDLGTQQNANLAVSATLGRRFRNTDFVLAFQTIATGKTYETFVGGRRDIQLQTGPILRYTPSANASVALAVNYYQVYSSVSSAAWHGFIIQPTITVLFASE